MNRIETALNLAHETNYTALETGHQGDMQVIAMGNPDKGDYGTIKLDHAKGHAYLSFRGSDDLLDWWSNVFQQKPNALGYNTGFFDGADQFRQHYRVIPDGYTIYGQAHSRGGGLLQPAADIILSERPSFAEKIDLITFGCPKVSIAGTGYHEALNAGALTHTTITNGRDIVPRAPSRYTRYLGGEFRQRDEYIRIANKHIKLNELSGWEKYKFIAESASRIAYAIKTKSISGLNRRYATDHNLAKYRVELHSEGLIG